MRDLELMRLLVEEPTLLTAEGEAVLRKRDQTRNDDGTPRQGKRAESVNWTYGSHNTQTDTQKESQAICLGQEVPSAVC